MSPDCLAGHLSHLVDTRRSAGARRLVACRASVLPAPLAWTASCVTATRRDQGQASALQGSALISAAGRLSPAEVSRIHPRATVSPKRSDGPLPRQRRTPCSGHHFRRPGFAAPHGARRAPQAATDRRNSRVRGRVGAAIRLLLRNAGPTRRRSLRLAPTQPRQYSLRRTHTGA
jgi:hypothetical protein